MKKGSGRKQASGTALDKFQRLESMGLWRDSADAQRKEVVVSMRQATLILSDPRSDEYLSHWSLPAILRLNPGQEPPLYAPAEDCDESLEITDPEMVEALRKVASVVGANRPKPGRLRMMLVGATLLAVLGTGLFILPDALKSHTAQMAPAAARAEIGQKILDDIIKVTGQPCTGELGLPALAALSERAMGAEATPILYILPEGITRASHLPGGAILLPRSLLRESAPDALAGSALVEHIAAQTADPLKEFLDFAGLRASFDLLTTGRLPDSAYAGYGEYLLRQPPADLPTATLASAFEAAEIPLSPWAQWRAPNAERTVELVAADPFKGKVTAPVLADDDWVALQTICSG